MDAALPGIDPSVVTLGGEGFGTAGRFLIGGSGQALIGSEETTTDGAVRIEAAGGYGDEGGLLVGVKAGYTLAPGDASWTLDAVNDVAGGPDFAIEGGHVRLSLGGWGGPPQPSRRIVFQRRRS